MKKIDHLKFTIKYRHANKAPLKNLTEKYSKYKFNLSLLEKVAYHGCNELDIDVLLLLAAIDYADRKVTRHRATAWARELSLTVPSSNPSHWETVKSQLEKTLHILTGDKWNFSFKPRPLNIAEELLLPATPEGPFVIIPYSDGLDSYLAGQQLLKQENPLKQLRVTVGHKGVKNCGSSCEDDYRRISIPVSSQVIPHQECTYRTRPFKFLMFCALAAKWTNSTEIFIPENGQGIFSPILTPKGDEHIYYGSHPYFTNQLQQLVKLAIGYNVAFVHPNIWKTKGEMLRSVLFKPNYQTKLVSCVLDQRQGISPYTHCGICTNCLLRRVSFVTAGIKEEKNEFFYSDINGTELKSMSNSDNLLKNHKFHNDLLFQSIQAMERFGEVATSSSNYELKKHAYELSQIGFCPEEDAVQLLTNLVQKHCKEWNNFLTTLSDNSLIKRKLKAIR